MRKIFRLGKLPLYPSHNLNALRVMPIFLGQTLFFSNSQNFRRIIVIIHSGQTNRNGTESIIKLISLTTSAGPSVPKGRPERTTECVHNPVGFKKKRRHSP